MQSFKRVFFVRTTQCCFSQQATGRGTEVQHESMASLAGVLPGESMIVGDGEGETIRVKKLMLEVQDSPSLRPGKCFVITPTGLRQSNRKMIDGRTIVGTDPNMCDIVMGEEDKELGKMHFVVEFSKAGDCFLIKDLGDGNGTFMKIEGSHVLHNGDVLSFGASHAGVQIQPQGCSSTFTLRFFEGPRASDMLTFGVNEEVVKIGRMHDCAVMIDDNNLSRYQCVIKHIHGKGWIVSDGVGSRKSANGTWYVPHRLYLERDFRISNNMIIRAGKTLFRVRPTQASLTGEERRL